MNNIFLGVKKAFFVALAAIFILSGFFVGTDAKAASTFTSISIGSQTGTLATGVAGSATYTVTVSRTGNGNLDIELDLVGSLPSGATASFSPSTVSFTGNTPTSKTSTLTITTTSATPAGTTNFNVKGTDLSGDDPDRTTSPASTLVINKSNQTINVTTHAPASSVYGATFPVAATATSGLSVAITTTGGCSVSSGTVTMTSSTNACVVHYNQSGNSNYNAATEVTETITTAVLPVVLSGARTYDGTSSADTSVLSILNKVGSDDVSLSSGTVTLASKNFGAQNITSIGAITLEGSAAANYTLVGFSGSVAISKASLTITAQTDTKPYDKTNSSSPVPLVSALQGSDTVTGLTQIYTDVNVGTGKTLTVASYTVNDGNSGDNYSVTTVNNTTGEITALSLTVTAVTDTKIYDSTLSSDGNPIVTGTIISGDTANFNQAFDTVTAGTGKTLIPSGIVNDDNDGHNYTVTFVNDTTGVITAKALTVTVDSGQSKIFGSSEPTLTFHITSGELVGTDELSGSLTRAAGEDVGMYAIEQGTLSAGENYALTFVGTNFEITPADAPITINAADLNQNYNGAPRIVTATTTPEGISYEATYNGSTTPPTNAGSYSVVVTITDTNYTAATDSGTLIIHKVDPTIVVTPYTVSYDGASHTAAGSATGVLGETLSGLDLSNTTHTNVGIYSEDTWSFTDSTGNYNNVSTTTITNVINKANQTIDFGALSDKGATDSDFTVTATATSGLSVSFAAEGTCTILGNTVHIAGIGSCTITASQQGDDNYNAAESVDQTFNITDKSITLTIVKKITGEGNATFKFSITGQDDISLTTAEGIATSSAISLAAGSYNVTETITAGWQLESVGCIEEEETRGVSITNGKEISLAEGDHVTCTFTNTKAQPKLTVTKVVVNNNNGTKGVSDFPLFVGETSVSSGVEQTFTAGTYTVRETTDAGYGATFSGDCGQDGSITLALGDVKTCTITNDDIAPAAPATTGGGGGGGSTGFGGRGGFSIHIMGDVNSDGKVDILDLNIIFANWGNNPNNTNADINQDGKVDILDLNVVMVNWTI